MASSDILSMLNDALDDNALDSIGNQLGIDSDATERAVSAALPTLLGAAANNASDDDGAKALHSALERDHDGSVLNDVNGFFQGGGSSMGGQILGHLLGRKQESVEQNLGKATGIGVGSSAKLLAMLAPLVLGALGRKNREQKMDTGGLRDMLSREQQHVEKAAPSGFLTKMLDADGDGDFDFNDILKHGTGMLGGMFRRRR